MPLVDKYGRNITYLRMAVTDRCNLRCFYCMPEEGIDYVDRKDLLSYEEMDRFCRISSELGVSKLRITGGEPLVRKGILEFIERINQAQYFKEIHITTNGTLTAEHIPHFHQIGIHSVNLSLDTLNRERFAEITRRDWLHRVEATLERLFEYRIHTKINMVVMGGKNIADIVPMAELAKHNRVDVRYIEEMPFNGTGEVHSGFWNYKAILDHLMHHLGPLHPIRSEEGATATSFKVDGFKGTLGVIPAFSRTFCGTCNRIRITPKGTIKTCLYDQGTLNIRDIIRRGVSDEKLARILQEVVASKYKDGFEAESDRLEGIAVESMAEIGG